MITKKPSSLVLLLTMSLLFCNSDVQSQTNDSISEEIRSLIFMSIEIDGPYKYNMEKWDNLVILLKNHHDNIPIVFSKEYSFILPKSNDTISDGYSLQVYKITIDNSQKKSRYLLRYKGFDGALWLRVSGYAENDVKVFFEYLKSKGVKRKDFARIVDAWEGIDPLFSEVNFSCLLKGYLNDQTNSDCFIAVSYIEALDQSIGFDPINEKDVYSTFSRIPLFGFNVKERD